MESNPNQPQALDQQVGGNHYKNMKIQVVEFCQANNIPYNEGSIIKYVCRHKAKGGKEDLLKARHWIDMIIQMEYPEQLAMGARSEEAPLCKESQGLNTPSPSEPLPLYKLTSNSSSGEVWLHINGKTFEEV